MMFVHALFPRRPIVITSKFPCHNPSNFPYHNPRFYSEVHSNPSWIVNQLNQIAGGHILKKEDNKAIAVLKKALDICKFHTPTRFYLSEDEPKDTVEEEKTPLDAKFMIFTLTSMAKIYNDNKNIGEAKESYEKALLVADRLYDKTDECRLDLMCRVGEFYYQQGDRKASQDIFLSVLELNREKYGPSGITLRPHPATANYYLGLLEFDAQNYLPALNLLNLSWKLYRTITNADSPQTAMAIAGVGKVYMALENYEKAREHLEFAVALLSRFGKEKEIANLEEIHKEVLKNIPGAVNRAMVYSFNRHGAIKQVPVEVDVEIRKEENLRRQEEEMKKRRKKVVLEDLLS